MKITHNPFSKYIVLALAMLAMSGAALSQSDKPLTLVVPFPPGGSTDITARTIQTKLAERIGRPVIIENRPGASGFIGADLVAQSPADGYTLLMGSTAAVTEKNIAQFSPVALVSASPVSYTHLTLPTNREV